jgi:hypothetical protein
MNCPPRVASSAWHGSATPLGFALAAPGELKVEKGTNRGLLLSMATSKALFLAGVTVGQHNGIL